MGVPAPAGRYRSLELEFAAGVLSLRCDDDTDEIIVRTGRNDRDVRTVRDLWVHGLLGTWIELAWDLRNHRGYGDAFQLRLLSDDRDEHVRQFEVAGSTIGVQTVATI